LSRYALFCVVLCAGAALLAQPAEFTRWSAEQCESIGQSTYAKSNIQGRRSILATERAKNYKLRATWFTPEVLRASARLQQLRNRLPDAELQAMVEEAEALGGTVVMVELDPNEGSGVIPPDWKAFLSNGQLAIAGVERPDLRAKPVFQGVLKRNYDYDRFWVLFPWKSDKGERLASTPSLELTVQIEGQEGSVRWPVPASLRDKGL
jgi:hypothetical protein